MLNNLIVEYDGVKYIHIRDDSRLVNHLTAKGINPKGALILFNSDGTSTNMLYYDITMELFSAIYSSGYEIGYDEGYESGFNVGKRTTNRKKKN